MKQHVNLCVRLFPVVILTSLTSNAWSDDAVDSAVSTNSWGYISNHKY